MVTVIGGLGVAVTETGATVTDYCGDPCFHLPCQHCVLLGQGFEGNPFAWSVISSPILWGHLCSSPSFYSTLRYLSKW